MKGMTAFRVSVGVGITRNVGDAIRTQSDKGVIRKIVSVSVQRDGQTIIYGWYKPDYDSTAPHSEAEADPGKREG